MLFCKNNINVIGSVLSQYPILGGGGSWLDNQPVIFKSKALSILAVWLNTFHIYGFTLVSGYIFQYLKVSDEYDYVHDLQGTSN